MILAGNLPAIEPSIRKRNSAVRTGVAHSEITARGGAPQDQWNAQQHGRCHALAGYLRRSQRGKPVVIQQRGARPGGCDLGAINFASHGSEFPYYSVTLEFYEPGESAAKDSSLFRSGRRSAFRGSIRQFQKALSSASGFDYYLMPTLMK